MVERYYSRDELPEAIPVHSSTDGDLKCIHTLLKACPELCGLTFGMCMVVQDSVKMLIGTPAVAARKLLDRRLRRPLPEVTDPDVDPFITHQ